MKSIRHFTSYFSIILRIIADQIINWLLQRLIGSNSIRFLAQIIAILKGMEKLSTRFSLAK